MLLWLRKIDPIETSSYLVCKVISSFGGNDIADENSSNLNSTEDANVVAKTGESNEPRTITDS